MVLLLNSHNVFDYLFEHNFCDRAKNADNNIKSIDGKNFNLLITLTDDLKLLVKQERHDCDGKTAGEFLSEWRIQECWQQFSELDSLRPFLPEILHFDPENSIIIFRYLDDYRDLMDFYGKENNFSTEIAVAIGAILATIHRDTFDRQNYQEFFCGRADKPTKNKVPKMIRSIERITPEIFGSVPADGLKFFALYQRYDSLGNAIAELSSSFSPCCLTHNDLKLNNILLHNDWERSPLPPLGKGETREDSIIRLIDWERATWGDPAFDLGTLITSYLQIWLSSLVISKSLSIEESLNLAMTPLQQLQPAIAAFTQAYLNTFPAIVEYRPDFLKRVVQLAGFGLIQRIQAMIEYQKSFGNMGIAMLQVAKALLCRPEQSMQTIFGAAAELIPLSPSAV